MTCTATIRVYDNRSAIVVNSKGVFAEDGEHVVYLLTDKAPQPVRRVVKLGHRNKEMVEVLNGLRVGDRILQDQPND